MSILTENGFGRTELELQKQARKQITESWEGIHFLDGLDGYVKENVAMLYENEAKWLNEATDASNSGSFETVVFPIIRRVFSKLLANDIVSVQAMNLPIGKLFFILPVTSERVWDNEEMVDGATGSHRGLMGYERTDRRNGEKVNRYYLPDDVVNDLADGGKFIVEGADDVYDSYAEAFAVAGNANLVHQLPMVTKYMEKTLYDLFYNNFLYDNSKGKIHIRVGNAVPVKWDGKSHLVECELADSKICGIDDTVRNVLIKVSGFSSYNAGRLTGPDGNEMDTEAFVASLKVVTNSAFGDESGTTFESGETLNFRFVTQKYGKGIVEYDNICDAEGCIYLDVDLAKPVKVGGTSADGFLGVSAEALSGVDAADFVKVAWAQYDSLELETEIGEVSFKLDSVVVSVEERKLRATWSPEMAQDVAAFHNIDAEAELTALLSEQIAAEIDREILRVLLREAPWVRNWDLAGWRKLGGFSTNYTQKDWNQTLITEIERISAQIHKSTLRGGANFIVVSSEVSATFNDLEYFHVSDASAESDQYNMGIERVGELGGRYQVYRDPLLPHYDVLIGHKGKSLLDTGFIYAPYVPMQLTPTMYNPENFAPVKGIMTRYAQKCVNNKFYGRIKAHSLPHWNIQELR